VPVTNPHVKNLLWIFDHYSKSLILKAFKCGWHVVFLILDIEIELYFKNHIEETVRILRKFAYRVSKYL